MRRLSVLLGVTEELAERVASALEGDSVSPMVSLSPRTRGRVPVGSGTTAAGQASLLP